MPRQSSNIQINSDAFRKALMSRNVQLTQLAEQLNVTKQAVNGWLAGESMAPRRLAEMIDKIDLSPEEVEEITTPKQVQSKFRLFFRTMRNAEVSSEIRSSVTEMIRDFFQLMSATRTIRKRHRITIKTTDAAEMAKAILKELELPSYPITMNQVLIALESLCLPVCFIPFRSCCDVPNSKAFTASDGDCSAIFVDLETPAEDVLFNIFHELAHIFSDHSDTVTKSEEIFCNAVASEIMTPQSFFIENKEFLKEKFRQADFSSVFAAQKISDQLGASFEGVVISLKKFGLANRSVGSYLYAAVHNKKKRQLLINDFIVQNKEGAPEWLRAISDPTKKGLVFFQILVLQGALLNKISLSRAAELFDADVMTIQELIENWKARNVSEAIG